MRTLTIRVLLSALLITTIIGTTTAEETGNNQLQSGLVNYLLQRQKHPLPDDFIHEYALYLSQKLSGDPAFAHLLMTASRTNNGKPLLDLGIIGDARYGGLTPAFTKQSLKEIIDHIQRSDPLANGMFHDLWSTTSRPDNYSMPANINTLIMAQRPSGAGALANVALIDGQQLLKDLVQNFTPKKQRRTAYIAADPYAQQLEQIQFIKAEYFPDNGDSHYTEVHWFWYQQPPSYWQELTTRLTMVDFNRIHDQVALPPTYVRNIVRSSGPSLRFTQHGLLKIDDAFLNRPGFESDLYTPSVKIQSLLGYGMVQLLRNSPEYYLFFNDFINAYSERCVAFIQNRVRYTTRVDQVITQGGFEVGREKGREHTIHLDRRYLESYELYTQRLNNMLSGKLFQLLSQGQNNDAISAGISLTNRKNRTVESLIDKGCDSKVVQVVYHNLLHETGQVPVDASLRY